MRIRAITIFLAISINAMGATPISDLEDELPGHPIPRLNVIDVHGVRKAGGSDLVIVIASPLRMNELSQRRLLKKIENYLNFISSKEFSDQYGEPTPSGTAVVVHVNSKSDEKVIDLLERCRPWVEESRVSLHIELL
jgi:hypothetical protein